MLVKENPISKQYHQVYFTFSIMEIDNIFQDIIDLHCFTGKDIKRKIDLITKLVMDKIEEEIIEDELEKLEVVPVLSKKFRYLTEVKRGKPLLVICQFCIISPDIKLAFPPFVPMELLTVPFKDEVLDDFTNKILEKYGEYSYQEQQLADEFSIVTYDLSYVQDNYKLSEIKDVEIDLSSDEEEVELFINAKPGDIITIDNSDKVTVLATVTKIMKKVNNQLTDEIVSKMNFLGTKTVKEFNKKIMDIFSFSTNSLMLIDYLVAFVLKASNFQVDNYVINHFLDHEFAPKKKKEQDSYIQEVIRELVKEYILIVIDYNYEGMEPRFLNWIIEEYEFEKILFDSPARIDSYQEYVNRRIFETRVLEYCIDNNLINYKI